jgi:hypothetical protein
VAGCSSRSFASEKSDVLANAAAFTADHALTQFASPLGRKPKLLPDSWRAALQEIFAVGVCGEGNFDSAIIENLPSYQR